MVKWCNFIYLRRYFEISFTIFAFPPKVLRWKIMRMKFSSKRLVHLNYIWYFFKKFSCFFQDCVLESENIENFKFTRATSHFEENSIFIIFYYRTLGQNSNSNDTTLKILSKEGWKFTILTIIPQWAFKYITCE